MKKLLQKIFPSMDNTNLKMIITYQPTWHDKEEKRTKESYFVDKKGLKQGLYQSFYYENNKVFKELNYKDGKLHGVCKWFMSYKYLKIEDKYYLMLEENYKDGKLHGVYKSFYSDGKPHMEANCKDGKLHGVYRLWDLNGNLVEDKIYEDDKILTDFIKDKYSKDRYSISVIKDKYSKDRYSISDFNN